MGAWSRINTFLLIQLWPIYIKGHLLVKIIIGSQIVPAAIVGSREPFKISHTSFLTLFWSSHHTLYNADKLKLWRK